MAMVYCGFRVSDSCSLLCILFIAQVFIQTFQCAASGLVAKKFAKEKNNLTFAAQFLKIKTFFGV
jgi:hypothetical protein